MKNVAMKIILLLMPIVVTACATVNNTWIPLNTAKINTSVRARTSATVYIQTYGQERFMNITAMILNSFSAMVSSANMQTGFRYNPNNSLSNTARALNDLAESIRAADYRKNSSELEKKMGDYNLFFFFLKSLAAAKDSVKYFDIVMDFDSTEHAQVINRLCTYNNENLDPAFTRKSNNNGNKYISAFKFQYGIGARAGGEQFSLTKKYRPFVRVVGLVKDVNTNEFVWGNKITVFSKTVYRGVDEAKNAEREELIQELEIITHQLIDIITSDLNGQRYTSEEYLVDYNPAIDDVL